ncbi:hypothetical protein MKZ38_007394 [Zalerion maritima]|uniref:Uncharacterized protein n=1 Tax=Zalerion maritima TaxID=339359 RepID=A0AAD5WPT2_9PEZI|nr:hypothetical protein MKZ38_007394 [Zalerion maritima]
MPVVKPSFQSESRLETSTSSSYSTSVTTLHLGILALVAVAGIRYALSVWSSRRRKVSTLIVSAPKLSWSRDEKSRGVSILRSGTMSAGRSLPKSISSQGSDVEGLAGGKGLTKLVEGETTEASEGLETLATSSPGRQSVLPMLSRPPPPPPLTVPEVSPTVFSFDDRRRSFPPVNPALNTESFIHQPNPDYIGDSSTSSVTHGTSASEIPDFATTPRRRSYTKTVAFSIPNPGPETANSEFAPSSFPSASPQLPPPAEFPETGHVQHEVDVHGEIIASLDGAGHGWKRHTRVYCGGVCLACLQSGGEGGFYGENVRPEDRR